MVLFGLLQLLKHNQFLVKKLELYLRFLLQKFLGLPKFHPANYAHYNLGKHHEISTTTRNFLREFFKPYNEQLFKFLDKKFDWNI